jgi:preprotein translocase subunit SecF
MEFFKKETAIDFMGLKNVTAIFSITISILSLFCLYSKGINLGMEFTGGTQLELRFAKLIEPSAVRIALQHAGFKEIRVQNYGSSHDVLVRMANSDNGDENEINKQLSKIFNKDEQTVEIRRIERIGSEVGKELAEQGGLAVLLAILATMVYIALRFEYRFAFSAALSLCHDAVIVLGIFSFFQVEFDLATLAGILAVLGYSLNDTIVVFDRIREIFRRARKESTAAVINLSINQTLSRTIVTSGLTFIVVLALLCYGGKSLFGFSLALCVGIVFGTYSSIYVASTLALILGLSRADLLPKPKVIVDDLP